MFKHLFAKNEKFVNATTQQLARKINADPKEVKVAIEQLQPVWEKQLTEQVEAQVLANRRNMLDKTLADSEEQHKHTLY